MTETYILALAMEALKVTLMLAAPVLLVSLVVGVIVSIFQAATQINEVTLTFIPKIIGISVVLAILGSWMGQQLLTFTTQIFNSVGNLPR